MSPSSDAKQLRVLASFANRFQVLDTPLYIAPARTNLCPPASINESRTVTIPVARKSTPPRATHNLLNAFATEVQQFGTLYHETRIPVGPIRRDFFVLRPSTAAVQRQKTQDSETLKELNRLARLFELSGIRDCPLYHSYTPPCYASPHSKGKYTKGFSSPFDHVLRKKLNLTSSFASAFPKTTIPKPTFLKGHPVFERSTFNSLLAIKLAEARSVYHINHTPKHLPRLITSWICALFVPSTTPSAPKKKKTTRPAKPEVTCSSLSDRFTSEAVVPSLPQVPSSSPEPVVQPTTELSDFKFDSISSVILAYPRFASNTLVKSSDDVLIDTMFDDAAFRTYLTTSLHLSSPFDSLTLRDLSKCLSSSLCMLTLNPRSNAIKNHILALFFAGTIVIGCPPTSLYVDDLVNFDSADTKRRLTASARFQAVRSCLSDLSALY
jgi:hypothetical protein